jgi:lipooligosaccharide transport system permease protein
MALVSRVIEHRARQYARTFRASVFGSFVNPVMFLTAMGIGLGGYVNRQSADAFGGLTYIQFLAPGLLAATVMQSGAFEATFPIIGGLQWSRIFHAMYATPIQPRHIALGNLAWIALRLSLIASVFTLVIVLLGAAVSPLIVLAIPAAVLCGMAFAAPIAAFNATQRRPDAFSAIFRFGITPLFLLSGTFFPLDSLPAIIRPIAWLSPLWHGVELTRGLAFGTIGDAPLLGLAHLAILATIVTVGCLVAVRTVEARLVRG